MARLQKIRIFPPESKFHSNSLIMILTDIITPELIDRSMSYAQYRSLIEELLADDMTTGTNHSEQMVGYTRLNVQRSHRVERTVTLTDEMHKALDRIERPMIWLVLTEAWCGDAAQNVPVFDKLASASDKISMHLILRDEHPEVMDMYLTNGGRAIPKLVALDAETMQPLFVWGPRPAPAQRIMTEYKEHPEGRERQKVYEAIHKWYAKDRGRTLQAELAGWIRQITG